jgi:hypothetical protein
MPIPPTTPPPPPNLLDEVRRHLGALLRGLSRLAQQLTASFGALSRRLGQKELGEGQPQRPSRPDHPGFSPSRPTKPPVSLGESPTSAAEKPRMGPGIAQPSGESVLVGSVRAQLLLRSVQQGEAAPPEAPVAPPSSRPGAADGAQRPGTAPAGRRPPKS